ncbi:NAD(P)-binding protein [Macrolepiota fuliginosa MF-IS2]|uniref:NAD(P)-binding protein n=1 Tax=Macrolepiota fuliginosa MF-IS2 TaxID=1400762 RepID=A0A9P6C5D3_9AGAR|nr:NAD(P)-binding protein [Macrolepiota fuliginosa MF-IS2]
MAQLENIARRARYKPMLRRLFTQSLCPSLRRISDMAALQNTQKKFLSSPNFAVVGASKDPTKFGTKILKWYQERKLKITPVHPKESELEGVTTVKSLKELVSPSETSVSIVTPAKVTLSVLKEAKELGVPTLWIQPGAEDAAVVEFIKDNDLEERVIYGGPCLLVEGDRIKSLL